MSKLKTESHPFSVFLPSTVRCLILGSFPGKEQTRGITNGEAWFYGAPLNQFWRILSLAYHQDLSTRKAKQELCEKAGIAITDIFSAVVRMQGSNLDENLQVVTYNWKVIETILKNHHPAVRCTSRFVEKEFKKRFPAYAEVEALPSPSPRYFRISIAQKAAIYQQKLPPL